MLQNLTFKCLLKMLKRPLRLYCVYLKAELFSCADSTRCCGTLNTVEPLSRRFHAGFTPVSHCKRGRRVSGTEAVRMQSRSSARPLPFHTCSVCSARAEQRLLYRMGKFESNFKYNWSWFIRIVYITVFVLFTLYMCICVYVQYVGYCR